MIRTAYNRLSDCWSNIHSNGWTVRRLRLRSPGQAIDGDLARLEIGVSELGLGRSADRRDYVVYEPSEVSKFSAGSLALTAALRWLELYQGQLWTRSLDGCGGLYATLQVARAAPDQLADSNRTLARIIPAIIPGI